ncbi:MAG: hypothetical protein IIB72_04330 [Proteobacteria bacterium]|nr:hypothetical protein [Pseudomonadota bacterium]
MTRFAIRRINSLLPEAPNPESLALIELEALGYTNVENVGGIADARERLAE